MEWNTLIAVGGTIFGAIVGAGASIWLGKAQHTNDSKTWEKDKKLIEYTRVVTGFGDVFNRLVDYLHLSRASRTDVHDIFNDVHRTTMLLLAPSDVMFKYNAMYRLFTEYTQKMQANPSQENRDEWPQFKASYRAIRRELTQEMRKDLDLPLVSFEDFDQIESMKIDKFPH